MVSKAYNGWDKDTRSIRGRQFYTLVKRGVIRPIVENTCELCGAVGYPGMTYHAEEYGPTFIDYMFQCHYLCARCHGLFHLRESMPNRFNRYIHYVTRHGPLSPYKHIGEVFGKAKGLEDIPYFMFAPAECHWANSIRPYTNEKKQPITVVQHGVKMPVATDHKVWPDIVVHGLYGDKIPLLLDVGRLEELRKHLGFA